MMWIEYDDLLDAMESAISCVAKNAVQMEHAICKGFCSLQERKLWVELKIYLDEVLYTWKCAVDLQLKPQNIARKRTTFLSMDLWTPEEVRVVAQTWLRFRNAYQEALLYLTLPTTTGPALSDIRNLFLSSSNYSHLDAVGELRWCGYGDQQEVERANWLLQKLTRFLEEACALSLTHRLSGLTHTQARKELFSMILLDTRRFLSSYEFSIDTLFEFQSKEDLWNGVLAYAG